jgi:hypothetical protein
MPVKPAIIVSFLLGALSFAQEVRQIDLTGVPENRETQPIRSGKNVICSTDDATSARTAVRVSVESLTPTDIHPKEQLSVVLRVENDGRLPLVLPLGPRNTDFQVEPALIRYTAMLPLMAGVPSGGIMLGWLALHGSTAESNTTVSLKPGEWITIRGDIRVRRWFNPVSATAYSDLQLYEWFSGKSDGSGERCVKQISGASIPIRFESLKKSP